MRTPGTIARAILPAFALAWLVAACSDSSGPSIGSATNLSIAVATLTAGSIGEMIGLRAIAPAFDRHVMSTGGTHTLVITRAAVALARLELSSVDSAGCAADDHPENDDRCQALESGPALVELPVDNSVISLVTLQLPAGTYRALEAKIRPVLSTDSGGAAFLAANPQFAHASVRVEGTFDGTRFVYAGAASASLELAFDPPVTIGTTATTLTVHVSIDRWFSDGSGTLIDPATANSGGANEQRVSDNVRRSFHAFEDNERHGDDGHGDDGFHDAASHDGGDGSRTQE